MTPGAEIKPGRHCRKASVLNTRPTLPKKEFSLLTDFIFSGREFQRFAAARERSTK